MVTIISPIDGSVVAERSCAAQSEIDTALKVAQTAQRQWRATPVAERARFCLRAVDALVAMADEIAPELARQMGRPVRYGRNEVLRTAERARHMIEIAPARWPIIVPRPSMVFAASCDASRSAPCL